MKKDLRKFLIFCVMFSSSVSGQSRRKMFLNNLVTDSTLPFTPVAGFQVLVFPTSSRLQQLPWEIRSKPQLAALSLYHSLVKKPRRYDLGVLDERSRHHYIFVAPRKEIPSWDRLYWVMMRVMSKEYACFMVERSKSEDQMAVRCRDGRGVYMKRFRGQSWIAFESRRLPRFRVRKTLKSIASTETKSANVLPNQQQKWLLTSRCRNGSCR